MAPSLETGELVLKDLASMVIGDTGENSLVMVSKGFEVVGSIDWLELAVNHCIRS